VHQHTGRTDCSLSKNSAVIIDLLTVATHVHNVLCVLRDVVQCSSYILCAGDHYQIRMTWLSPVSAFDAIALGKFYLTSRFSVCYVTNKTFLCNIVCVSRWATVWFILWLVQGCSLGLERLGVEAVLRRFLERLGLEGWMSRSRLSLESLEKSNVSVLRIQRLGLISVLKI